MAPAELSSLAVARIDPATDPRWEELMRGPLGSLFGSPQWIAALADAYGFDISADLLLDPSGQAVAGLARAELDDFRGRRIVSLPFTDFLDPVVGSFEQWDELVSPLLGPGVPVSLRCLRTDVPLGDARFEETNVACWHATALERPFDELVAGLHPQVRQNSRRAERSGVTVRISDRLEDVRAFHALHRGTRKSKYRLLAQPLAFFESLWERFSPSGSIVVGLAEHSGEAIGGALYLVWNGVFYYKFGASRRDGLGLRPNELLARESMRHALERGCRLYDWGLSEYRQPGLVSFKRKLATIERPITFLRSGPERSDDPAAGDSERLLRGLTELLTGEDVPDEVTQRGGELLYRYFA